MKRFLLFSLITVFITLISNAQSIQLYTEEGDEIENGSEVTVNCSPDDALVAYHVSVKNISTDTIYVKAKKEVISELEGATNTFCWDVCYGPNVTESMTALMIIPEAVNTFFVADYSPNEAVGITTVKYVFFEERNPSDSAAVTVHFNSDNTGITNLGLINEFSNVYPNPAGDFAKVDYSLTNNATDARIIISSILGSKVQEVVLNNRQGTAACH